MTKLEELEKAMRKSEADLREAHHVLAVAKQVKREAQVKLAEAAKAYQEELRSDPNRPRMTIGG